MREQSTVLDPKTSDLCMARFYNGPNRLTLQCYLMSCAM